MDSAISDTYPDRVKTEYATSRVELKYSFIKCRKMENEDEVIDSNFR